MKKFIFGIAVMKNYKLIPNNQLQAIKQELLHPKHFLSTL